MFIRNITSAQWSFIPYWKLFWAPRSEMTSVSFDKSVPQQLFSYWSDYMWIQTFISFTCSSQGAANLSLIGVWTNYWQFSCCHVLSTSRVVFTSSAAAVAATWNMFHCRRSTLLSPQAGSCRHEIWKPTSVNSTINLAMSPSIRPNETWSGPSTSKAGIR